MNPFGEIAPPAPVAVLWVGAAAGWGMVAAGLWRSLAGPARRTAVAVHGLTLVGVLMRSLFLGHGLLDAMLAATAGWWALVAVTGLRPARLIDPDGPAVVRLAAWFWVAAVVAVTAHHMLFSPG